jgi:hypothetical protein
MPETGARQDLHVIEHDQTVRRTSAAAPSANGGPSQIITRGYRLHGLTSFPIRRAEFHASPVRFSPGAQRLSALCGTKLVSPADGGYTLSGRSRPNATALERRSLTFRERIIFANAGLSVLPPAITVALNARIRNSERTGSHTDAAKSTARRSSPVKGGAHNRAFRHRDRLRRGTLEAGYEHVFSDF